MNIIILSTIVLFKRESTDVAVPPALPIMVITCFFLSFQYLESIKYYLICKKDRSDSYSFPSFKVICQSIFPIDD